MTRHSGVRGIIYLNAFCRDNEKDTGGTPRQNGGANLWQSLQFEEMANKRRVFQAPERTAKKDNKKDEVQPRHKGKETVVKVVFTFHSGQFQEGRDRSHQKPGHLPTRNYQWQQKE